MLFFLLILLPFTVNVIYTKIEFIHEFLDFFVQIFLRKKQVVVKLKQKHSATLPF